DVDALDEYAPGARGIEAGDEAEECRFAAAGRTGDGRDAPGGDRQVGRMQDRQRAVAARHGLRDAAKLDHEAAAMSSSSGRSAFQIVSAIRRAPSAFGWIPSLRFK